MTTITDELAAALRNCLTLIDGMLDGQIVGLKTYHSGSDALAKYEAAKVQERLMPDFAKENQYEFECGVCHKHALGHKGRCVCDACKTQNITEEKGFPVVKIPGHIVNHMEWKDHALIVTVGPRAQESSDLVISLRDCAINRGWPHGVLLNEAADRIEALETKKRS